MTTPPDQTPGQEPLTAATMPFEQLAEILTTPMDELARHLPEAEQQRYRDCQQSIVDAAVWSHPRYR